MIILKNLILFEKSGENIPLPLLLNNSCYNRLTLFQIRGFCEKVDNYNKEIWEKLKKSICCSYDIRNIREVKNINYCSYRDGLGEPEYHEIYLMGNLLLTLNRNDPIFLSNFQREIGELMKNYLSYLDVNWEYNFIRNIFGLPYLEIKFGEEKYREEVLYEGRPPIRVIKKTSPYGNEYIAKRKLPYNFGELVYRECIRYNSPHILLSVFNYYLGSGGDNGFYFLGGEEFMDFCDYPHWTFLLGNARAEYFTHDISDILIYREQVLYLSRCINIHIEEEEEQEIIEEENCMTYALAGIWIKKLAEGLKKYSDLLPPDPQNPSLFSPIIGEENYMEEDKKL